MKYLIHPLGHACLLDSLPEVSASEGDEITNQIHNHLLEGGFTFSPVDTDYLEDPKCIVGLRKSLKNPRRVTLIVPDDHHPIIDAVQSSLEDNGIDCNKRSFEGDIPQSHDMIVLVDFVKPYLYNMTESRFRGFIDRFSTFKGSMIWVTPGASISCSNPNSSMVIGLGRSLRAELRKDITVVEIEDKPATFLSSSRSLSKIYQSLGSRPKGGTINSDYEYAIMDGDIKIPRLHWTTSRQEVQDFLSHSVDNENGSQSLPTLNERQSEFIQFHSNASYILVGGLGGLGRVIATWMVAKGARNILFMGRSAKESPQNTPFFEELRALGSEVLTFSGSVTDLSDVEAAIKSATKPVKGIMQMSAVMRVSGF